MKGLVCSPKFQEPPFEQLSVRMVGDVVGMFQMIVWLVLTVQVVPGVPGMTKPVSWPCTPARRLPMSAIERKCMVD
jgi:hypothetical protein